MTHGGIRFVRGVRRALPLIPSSAALAEASLGDGMRVGTPNGALPSGTPFPVGFLLGTLLAVHRFPGGATPV
jgi:hypothetical protein